MSDNVAYINHIALVLDASASMKRLQDIVVKVADSEIDVNWHRVVWIGTCWWLINVGPAVWERVQEWLHA